MYKIAIIGFAVLAGWAFHPAYAQLGGKPPQQAPAPAKKIIRPVKPPIKAMQAWSPWLGEMNGVWRDEQGGSYQIYFSSQAMAFKTQFEGALPIQIIANDPDNDTVTFDVRLPGNHDRSRVSVKALGEATPEQLSRLVKAGVQTDRWNLATPTERAVLIGRSRGSIGSQREIVQADLNHWQRLTPTDEEETEYQDEQTRLRSPNSSVALNRVLGKERSDQIQTNRNQIAKYRQQLDSLDRKLAELDALEAELMDSEATKAAQAEEDAKQANANLLQLTLRRIWNDAHTQFQLGLFMPGRSLGLGYERGLLPDEIKALIAIQPLTK